MTREEIIQAMKAMENWMDSAIKESERLYFAYYDSEANHGAAMLNDGMAIAYRKATNHLHNIILNAEG